MMRSL